MLPDTGASMYTPDLPVTAVDMVWWSDSAKVAQSTMALPDVTPARVPAASLKTEAAACRAKWGGEGKERSEATS